MLFHFGSLRSRLKEAESILLLRRMRRRITLLGWAGAMKSSCTRGFGSLVSIARLFNLSKYKLPAILSAIALLLESPARLSIAGRSPHAAHPPVGSPLADAQKNAMLGVVINHRNINESLS